MSDEWKLCYEKSEAEMNKELTITSLTKLMGLIIPSLPPQLLKIPLGILDIGCESGITLSQFGKIYTPFPCFLIGLGSKLVEKNIDISRNIIDFKYESVTIEKITNLPQVHVSYSFDIDYSFKLMKHIENLQFKSYSLRIVITGKPQIYHQLYERWEEIGNVRCRLQESEREVDFYVFRKKI